MPMEDTMDPLLRICVCIILVLIDAMQTAYYTAVTSLSDSDLEPDDEGSVRIREPALTRVKNARANTYTLMCSVWFWQLLTAAEGTAVLVGVWKVSRFLAALAFTCIVYVLGRALPYISARLADVKTAGLLSAPCRIFTAVSVPFTWILNFAASIPLRLIGADPGRLKDEVTEDEILSMVNEGHEQGSIDEDEAEMISNIFELDDKQAEDIMTHRGDIDAFESSVTLDEAIQYMVDAPNSRFPVYEGSIDNIIGALYLKDAMLFHMKEQYNNQSIGKIPHLLREVKFIPETLNVDELLCQMQESRKQMAIVVNEYGETSGLVTMEDILEEIVGNILDEYDHEEKLIAKAGEGHLRMNGKALLEDVEKVLKKDINKDNYDTLSGYLTEKLGHIPTSEDRGREIEDAELGYRFRILSINGTMIGWLDVSKIARGIQDTSVGRA